jgi:osmotically-inducible protein OsmY
MSAEVQTSMATDAVIRRAIHDELDWIPEVDATSIAVAADSGIATLTGSVSTHGEKVAARDAAWRVKGVTAVIDELVVDTETPAPPSDEQRATAARHILELDGDTARLPGSVRSVAARRQAEEAAWCSPQIATVENHLRVDAG